MSKKEGKWTRTMELSKEEDITLDNIIENTKGFTRQGFRARCAVMLPPKLALYISNVSKEENKSIGEIIVKIVEKDMSGKHRTDYIKK